MKNQFNKLTRIYISIILIIGIGGLCSCKKFVVVDSPESSINSGNVYQDNANAIAVLNGLYAKMSGTEFSLELSLYPELSADNFNLFDENNTSFNRYYKNALIQDYNGTKELWTNFYSYIYVTNAVIEGVSNSNSLDPIVKQHLLGEAHFIRGFCYFYLVNLYGNVPNVLSTDYKKNAHLPRTPIEDIYKQIINDLELAKTLLDNKYLDGTLVNSTSDRLRPNKMAATAMLARVYLYMKNYSQAEIQSSEIINHAELYSPVPLEQVFQKNSKETIWSLQPVIQGRNTSEGSFYIFGNDLQGVQPGKVYMSDDFMTSFESGDQRKTNWIGTFTDNAHTYNFPFKYRIKVGNVEDAEEYTIVLRLSEQYFIRAEARTYLDNISGAIDDIDVIRDRAKLPLFKATIQNVNKNDLLAAILKERRVELFSEWGNRWLDLKRTGTVEAIMKDFTPIKGGVWSPHKTLYPIPLEELQADRNLNQNPGY